MMNLRNILFVFISVQIGNFLCGQNILIETKIDTNAILIGDQIALTYYVQKEKNTNIHYPVFGQNLIDGIEIIGKAQIDSSEKKESIQHVSLKLIITSFDTGIYYIPPQPFVILRSGMADTIRSKATFLVVNGMQIDTTGTIRDIKGPEKVSLTFVDILPYLLSIVLLALIVWVIYYFYQKRKRSVEELKPVIPSEPAYITALRELDKIKTQKLWQQKQVKEYYTRITYVIRWYISKRYTIHALEETSDEIFGHLKSLKLDKVNFSNLESLLNLADIVKFAKGEPDPNENIIHLDNAYEFIKLTKDEENQVNTGHQPANNNIS